MEKYFVSFSKSYCGYVDMEKEMEDINKNKRDREQGREDGRKDDEEHETLKYKGEISKHVKEKYD